MKKALKTINNPDELNKSLSYSSPTTWITLSIVIISLVGFFVWSLLYKIQIKVSGLATVVGGHVTLNVKDEDLSKLEDGQKVFISGVEGQIVSIIDSKPVVSTFSLNDGEYEYYVVVGEMKPIDFWFNNK